jgi:hypothetical protein
MVGCGRDMAGFGTMEEIKAQMKDDKGEAQVPKSCQYTSGEAANRVTAAVTRAVWGKANGKNRRTHILLPSSLPPSQLFLFPPPYPLCLSNPYPSTQTSYPRVLSRRQRLMIPSAHRVSAGGVLLFPLQRDTSAGRPLYKNESITLASPQVGWVSSSATWLSSERARVPHALQLVDCASVIQPKINRPTRETNQRVVLSRSGVDDPCC